MAAILYFLRHLIFLCKAGDHHGVHSPFIYAYITQCLYKEMDWKGTKSEVVFLKSRAYFSCKTTGLISENKAFKQPLEKGQGTEFDQTTPFDIVYVHRSAQHRILGFLKDPQNWGDATVVILDGIYASKQGRRVWKEILALPTVRVTVDLFCCGALFFRREQAPQHFIIRI